MYQRLAKSSSTFGSHRRKPSCVALFRPNSIHAQTIPPTAMLTAQISTM